MKPILLTALLFLSIIQGFAHVTIPSIMSDGMVLQRNSELKIWGWADPGENVVVRFAGKKYKAVGNAGGQWAVTMKPLKAGGPYSMEIEGSNKIVINDIFLGDVWLCAGQSNMDHYLGRHTERFAQEIADAENPMIRQLLVPNTGVMAGALSDSENIKWLAADPKNVLDFTVVGYFFALKLYNEYNVPIGIINSSVGGTQIQAWTSEDGLKAFPDYISTIEQNRDTAYVNTTNRAAQKKRKEKQQTKILDKGLTGELTWYNPAYEPLNWKPIHIPGYWEDQGVRKLDGVVWFRRELQIPEHMTGVGAMAKLGRIVDADEFYINGTKVGSTGYQYPQREYKVANNILKAGKNTLVIKVRNDRNKGGFVPDKPYFLIANNDTIDLKGTWQYKVGEVFSPVNYETQGIRAQDQPSALFNGMVAPFTNFALCGVVWYQGESNAYNPDLYAKLLPALINDWRKQWGNANLPFLIAQLPGYMDVDYSPCESGWAEMRDAQLQTAHALTNCGLGINIDLGEWNDIHPGNKKPVSERLALQAMEIAYHENDIVTSGPIYKSYEIDDDRIVLEFNHVGHGLISGNGEPLSHFAVAGTDKKYYWAKARIVDNKIIVRCEHVATPKYLRYAWADNPDFANLYNKDGLPASPFQVEIK